ncbi:preprotein translocase subunit YajC [Brevundimonas bacteroides]|jgi:preprotein translocase subunit YajC|uniref:preprotein translocase subunit YajC n=1 Tax=Brevundimonas bacteroides TaxID=74311 RepID=UPI0004974F4F|nr:preprotein translocase subunit YajC [Brevundimonas bacteroides]
MTTPADGGIVALIVQFVPFIAIFVLFYFLLIRPQQKRAKEHAALIAAVKRGDTIVLSSGLIGKVTRVEDAEVNVEIAPSVNVRVVKAMIAEVRNRTAIAANDSKPAAKA